MTDLRRVPLHDRHVALGAKMVPFAGWEMPIMYPSGVVAEHLATTADAASHQVSRSAGWQRRSHRGSASGGTDPSAPGAPHHGIRVLDRATERSHVASTGAELIVSGALLDIAMKVKAHVARADHSTVLVLDAVKRERTDLDLCGVPGDMLIRLEASQGLGVGSREGGAATCSDRSDGFRRAAS